MCADKFIIFDSSSEDEEIIDILSQPIKPNDLLLDLLDDDSDEDDFETIQSIIHPVINGVQRINRAKTIRYIENTVHRYTDDDFIMHFRLGRELAYTLINRFAASEFYKELCEGSKTEPESAEKHILSFLWFAGHSSSYRDVADRFDVALGTLFDIITRVTEFLLLMGPDIIKLPNAQEKETISEYFVNTKKFPGIIGAIDGTHIEIDRPKNDPDSYYTRKKRFAIHVQGLVNHEKKFLHVFIGYPASVHDARVFKESDLFPLLPNLCSNDKYILGDSAYPLMKELIVPYRDNGHLTRKQKTFNRTLSSCRIVVEHCFGQLKQRFRQLYHCKLRRQDRIVKFIYACCILHNIADANDLCMFGRCEPVIENENEHYDVELVYTDAAIRAYRDNICETIWNIHHGEQQ